jgi:L-malate glycosyltransferase
LGIKTLIKKLLFRAGQFWLTKATPFRGRYNIVFVFPAYELSGAAKVHLDIVSIFKDRPILVVFTSGIYKQGLLQEFKSVSEIFVIERKILKSLYLGMLSSFISRSKPEYLFGMGTPDFYSVIGATDSTKTKIIDINHAVYGLRYAPDSAIRKLYKRVVIDSATKRTLTDHYREIGILPDHICLINNKTYVPDHFVKPEEHTLSILFVGRSTYEKRVHLFPLIAKELEDKIDFELILVGVTNDQFKKQNSRTIMLTDEIKDKSILNKYYLNADILLLVSSREGFPLVLMEAMSFGAVPVCTPVGGIPFHIKSGFNGFLLDGNEEGQIVENAANVIIRLYNNREQLKEVSLNAHNYAKDNFSEKKFMDSYIKLLKF